MKNMVSTMGLAVTPVFPFLLGISCSKELEQDIPNNLVIMSDEHARQAMSIYSHPIGRIAPTPNIDRTGNEGIDSLCN